MWMGMWNAIRWKYDCRDFLVVFISANYFPTWDEGLSSESATASSTTFDPCRGEF